jgi:hypothetical protein
MIAIAFHNISGPHYLGKIPKDHISMDHEFCNRQLFTSCMHLPFFPHSTSHNENSCMISEKPKEYISKRIMMGLSTMYIK